MLSIAPEPKIKIGVSGCLLGQKVRYDTQHKYHWYIDQVLGKYFEYVSVCPELEVGMGVPRKSVRLVGDYERPEMIEPISGTNWTEPFNAYSEKKSQQFSELSGFIFKMGSPSCGVYRTKVYQKNGIPLPNGRGLFATVVCRMWPLLPVEEEGRLNDPKLRENFLARVFGYHRLQMLCARKFRRGDWVEFHQHNKYLFLSHSRKHYTALGRLVAAIAAYPAKEFVAAYSVLYMECLATISTEKKNADVLFHILGFLKKLMTDTQRAHVIEVIESYRLGIHPLIVPVTLLVHYITVHDVAYVKDQIYLRPHPLNLSLRNEV